MGNDHGFRKFTARALHASGAQHVVRRTGSIVDHYIFFRHLLSDPASQIATGRKEDFVRLSRLRTTDTALADVQQISDFAFTSAVELTYVTT